MFQRLIYYVLQLKAYMVFGRRVYAHGNFKVGNRKNVSIGERCTINTGVFILGHCQIDIGDRVTMSANCMLIDSGLDLATTDRSHVEAFVKVGSDVWIGAGAIILPNVELGRGCVVGAGSVVTRSVPEDCIVAGNPARVIRKVPDRTVGDRAQGQ